MYRRFHGSVVLTLVILLGVMLWPADALAQRARPRGSVRVSRPVVVRTYVYRPYYRPYFYGPAYWHTGFGWGYGWYDPFWGQRYPYPPPYGYYRDPDEASARIEVTPRDAQVYVDGYYVGTVDDFDGVFQRLHVRSGEHTLEIFKEGYRTIRERVNFLRGETYNVKFTMEPIGAGDPQPARPQPDPAAAPASSAERRGRGAAGVPPRGSIRADGGAIAIRVQPEGASVVINGERWDAPAGREPLVLHLEEGEHTIEVEKEGYRSYSAEIRVRRGETVPLNITLRPDRE